MMNYIIETHQLKKIYKDKAVVNAVNIHVKREKFMDLLDQTGQVKVQ